MCIRKHESPHTYTCFVCAYERTKCLLQLIVSLLPNQLSCMVNKSVVIGSALQTLWYQNLIKSLFQASLVACTKLCSVAMDTRQVTIYQTWKRSSTGWRFSGDYVWCHVRCPTTLWLVAPKKSSHEPCKFAALETTFPQPRVTGNRVRWEYCDIHTVINAWCTSQIAASDAASQRNRRVWRQLSALACWWYQASEWFLEIRRQRHD